MVEDASIWDDYKDDREGQVMNDTADIPAYGVRRQWTCCGKLSCVKGPHLGKQYLGLTWTARENGPDECLPDAKHQKRKFSNSVADLLEQDPANSVLDNEVQVQSKAAEVITVLDSSDV
jgi:hypothetical protein